MELSSFDDRLAEDLRDPEHALLFLQLACADGIDHFLYNLRLVMGAQDGGVQQVADASGVNRESLYRSLSKGGNPHIRTLTAILDALGLRLTVVSKDTPAFPEVGLDAVEREGPEPAILSAT